MSQEMKIKEGLEISTGEFWYDISKGGYIKPEEILVDPEMAKRVKDAVALVEAFEDACKEQIDGFEM